MAIVSLHVRIAGRVQGVGYRAFVEQQAVARELSGWVRNRRDGTVEAVLSGEAALVEEVIAALREGPRHAAVEDLVILGEVALEAGPFLVAPSL